MRCEFSAKTKGAAEERANGHCELCTRPLSTGDYHYDHIIPDGLGGEPTLDNCQVLCRSCHVVKTGTEDVPRIAKAKRVRRNHINARQHKGRPMPGTRRSGLKKKFNGEVVRR